MGAGNGVEVAGEVDVNVLHGQHLGVSAACRAALDAEHGAEARLAQDHYVLRADMAHRLGEAYGHRGLALAGLRRRHCGDYDQLPIGLVLPVLQYTGTEFSLILPVEFDVVLGQPEARSDLGDWFKLGSLCNLNIRWYCHLVSTHPDTRVVS